MNALGKLTAMVLSAGAIGVLIVGVRSVPDIKRYLKMRQM